MSLGATKNKETGISSADALTAFSASLEKADPARTTNEAFREMLEKQVFAIQAAQGIDPQSQLRPEITFREKEALFLGSQEITTLFRSLEEIDQAPLHEIAAFLADTVRLREQRDDLWLEGRLNLGIAYAALGEWNEARQVLETLIEICENGGEKMFQGNIALAI